MAANYDKLIIGAEEREGDDTPHAVYGASSSAIWLNCRGMFNLLERSRRSGAVPAKDFGSRYAAEGTLAHEAGENLLIRTLSTVIRDRETALGWPTASDVVVPDEIDEADADEFRWAVEVYLDHIHSYFVDARMNNRRVPLVGIELQVSLDQAYENEDWQLPDGYTPDWFKENKPLFGTADFVAVMDHRLVVADYKHGAGVPVDAKGNRQLRYYALGCYYRLLRENKGHAAKVREVEICIVQPRASGDPIKTETFGIDELLAFQTELVAGVVGTMDPNAPLNAGSWCRFCKAAAAPCPELGRKARDMAKQHFGELADADDAGATPETNPDELSSEQLANALGALPALKEWIKSVEKAATSRLARGENLPGFKAVRGRSMRRWRDERLVLGELSEKAADDHELLDKLAPRRPLSVAQMEKLAKVNDRAKAATDSIGAFVEKPEGSITYASEDDPRPAVKAAASSFDVIVDEDYQ